MADPLRPPLWREGWVWVIVAFAGMASVFALLQARLDFLRAQKPEIVYATYLGTGPVVQRRLQPGNDQAVFVQLDDGSRRMFGFSGDGRFLAGCTVGSQIALEKRGLAHSIASPACPSGEPERG